MVNSPYILGSLDVSEKKCVSGWGRTSVMRVCNLTNEAAIFHDKSEKQCESGIEWECVIFVEKCLLSKWKSGNDHI